VEVASVPKRYKTESINCFTAVLGVWNWNEGIASITRSLEKLRCFRHWP